MRLDPLTKTTFGSCSQDPPKSFTLGKARSTAIPLLPNVTVDLDVVQVLLLATPDSGPFSREFEKFGDSHLLPRGKINFYACGASRIIVIVTTGVTVKIRLAFFYGTTILVRCDKRDFEIFKTIRLSLQNWFNWIKLSKAKIRWMIYELFDLLLLEDFFVLKERKIVFDFTEIITRKKLKMIDFFEYVVLVGLSYKYM